MLIIIFDWIDVNYFCFDFAEINLKYMLLNIFGKKISKFLINAHFTYHRMG